MIETDTPKSKPRRDSMFYDKDESSFNVGGPLQLCL